ncbi:MAG TPA: UDP-N-acetylmuramate--L-alanine ligase [Patescibacteria group bacterium]|nr:UDP-N-acetylmuramate--L-alanine ligase [Patescibacteria group bacterium]
MAGHYHLIGIGGIGMSGIAQLLLKRGVTVTGSDVKENRITQDLRRKGARIFIGHDAKNACGADAVVYSSAIAQDNPEMVQANLQGSRLLKRAQALAELMQGKTVVTIAGSHGKTTTTSLVSYLLLEAGLAPTAAIGGVFRNIDTNAYFGDGDFFVAEADESDASFLCYHPKYSIVTNIDREHLDHYGDFRREVETFREFINLTDTAGCVFYCNDDPSLRKIMKDYRYGCVSFGLTEEAQIYASGIQLQGFHSQFDCVYKGKAVGHFEIALAGMHNVSNSLAVIALGLELGIAFETIQRTLIGYKGAGRRFEVKFCAHKCLVIDDYAHHPTEIRATLAAAKNLQYGRLIAVFQPHRYTRTRLLLDEFGRSFDAADYVIVTDIYAASEAPIEGVNAAGVCDAIRAAAPGKKVCYMPKADIVEHVLGMLRTGDLVIILGAGDIVKTAEEIAVKMEQQCSGAHT